MTARQARRQFLHYRATGNPEALGRVFDLTASRLLLVALHLVRDAQQAEDLVQTTFLQAIQAAGTYDPKRPLLPWLVGILTHRAKDLQRRQTLRRGAQEDSEPCADTEDQQPGPARAAQNSEVLHHVARALDAVPGHYRQVLVLHLVHDLRPIQIAHALERSPEAVRTQLHRGREMLRKALPRGLALPVAIAVALPGTGLAAARAKVMAAANAAMPAASTAATAAAVASTVGKSTWLGITAVSLGVVAGLLLLNGFDREDSVQIADGPDVTATVEDQEAKPAEGSTTSTSARTEIPATDTTGHGPLAVTVADELGRPLEATVWRWQEGESEITRKTTDASGLVSFASAEDPGALIATAPGQQLHVERLARLAGSCRLRLPPARRVQGWLLVDGKVPPEPIRLRLHGWGQDRLGFLPANLRREVLGDRSQPVEVTTAGDGSFEIGGMPDDWTGTIELPQHLWLRGPSREGATAWRYYGLKAPKTGLQLEATQLPTVRGQVVWADTGEAVPDADIMAMVYLADGHNTPSMGVRVDAQGRFCFGAYPSYPSRMRDWANHPERRCAMAKISLQIDHDEAIRSRLAFDSKERGGSGDVGTIRLQRATRLWCLVVDTDDKPIQGALVEGTSISKPTDGEGRTTVSVARADQRRFLAGARGYRITEVEAQDGSGSRQQPLRLQLPPGNVLRIQVSDPQGEVPSGFRVSVQTPGPLFTGPKRGHFTRVHLRLGSRFLSCRNPSRLTDLWYRYSLDDSREGKGEIVLPSLVADAPLEIKVMDRLGQEVAVRHVGGLATGAKTLAIRLSKQPISVAGQVLDVHGTPLPRARVSAFLDRREAQALVDRQGRFRLPPLHPTQALRVVASCPGHVTAALEDVLLQPDSKPLEFRLVAGREVRVQFVTTNGARVEVKTCRVDVDSPGIERLQPGVFRFKNLPARVVTFTTRIGNREYRLAHDTTTENARFVLPPMGSCTVEASTSLRPKDVNFLRARVLYAPSGDLAGDEWLRGAKALPVLRADPFLLPAGRYTVEVGHYVSTSDGGGKTVFRTVTSAKTVTVEAGTPSRCRF